MRRCTDCGFPYIGDKLSHSCVRYAVDRAGRALTALKLAQASLCEHLCMEHDELPTSHHPDCEDARQALRELIPGEKQREADAALVRRLAEERRLELEATAFDRMGEGGDRG